MQAEIRINPTGGIAFNEKKRYLDGKTSKKFYFYHGIPPFKPFFITKLSDFQEFNRPCNIRIVPSNWSPRIRRY